MDVNTQVINNSGVCTHSGDFFWQDYVVFSVGDNGVNDADFIAFCKEYGIGFKQLDGCYKGQTETSFLVNHAHYEQIVRAGWLIGQESVLLLAKPTYIGGGRHYRDATLLFLETGDKVPVGHFVSQSETVAKSYDAWTYDPSTKTYWCCVPDARAKPSKKKH